MRKKDTLFIGLMLFSMFFGAGNLIFPPFLGVNAGTSYWPAIAGFIVTGVGLPFAVLAAVSLVKGGVQTIGRRVHPLFSTVFTVVVYLCIGPFLAIPRNANVAFEMGIKPFLGGGHSSLFLFLFTILFFVLVYIVSLNPEKMEKYMGRWITPVLLLSMIVLCIAGFIHLHSPLQKPSADYSQGAFFKGFIEGYSTMDALAALAFGIVILTTIQQKGVKDRKQLTRYTLKSGIVAGAALALVYIALGLIGAKMASSGTYATGTDILTAASTLFLGQQGKWLLGLIFTLACFTTVVGLTSACGQYFSALIPRATYKGIIRTVAVVGFLLSNLGLDQILKVSVPFLEMAYPLTIVLIVLTFFHRSFKGSRHVYRGTIFFTGISAIVSGLKDFGISLGALSTALDMLPLSAYGLGWIVPAIFGVVIGTSYQFIEGKLFPEKDSQMNVS